jgi:hypothetical protein
VSPRLTFSSPSSRIVRMPVRAAAAAISETLRRSITIARISSFSGITS